MISCHRYIAKAASLDTKAKTLVFTEIDGTKIEVKLPETFLIDCFKLMGSPSSSASVNADALSSMYKRILGIEEWILANVQMAMESGDEFIEYERKN